MDVIEASFDSPARDEIISLWLTVEGVDSQIDDHYHKQQKLIHKFSFISLRKSHSLSPSAREHCFRTTVSRLPVPTARQNDVSRIVSFFDPVFTDERQDHGGNFVLPKRCKGFCHRNKP